MHVDAMTVPQPLGQIGDLARRTQSAGFSGLLFTETGRTAYLNAAVASQAAPGLELSTGVAVAFPRSPFVTAAVAWELQEATKGRFRLGLGTQVRTHVVRRYGATFERPGPGCATTCSPSRRASRRFGPARSSTTATSTTSTSSPRSGARDPSTRPTPKSISRQ